MISNRLFYCYLALLCWIPIPLASKPLLAQHLLIILTTTLSLFTLLHLFSNPQENIFSRFRAAKICLWLFIFNLGWLYFQTIEIPLEWIELLSPKRSEYFFGSETPQRMPLTLYSWQTQHYFLLSFCYLQIFCLTIAFVDSRRRLRQVLYTILILGLLQAVYGSFMTLSGIEKVFWSNKVHHIGFSTGTLLNRNHLANYLTFSTAAGIGLLLADLSESYTIRITLRETLRKITQWLLGPKGAIRISLIIMIIGLILTRSRMGNSAFLISLTSAGLIWLLLAKRLNRTTLILFLSFLIIDIFLMGTWFGIDELAERLEKTNIHMEIRALALPYMLQMAEDFWLTGVGAGNFANAFPLYSQVLIDRHFNEAHFDYLQFIIEQGIIGFIPLSVIVLLSFYQTLVIIRKKNSRLLKGVGFAVLMAMFASGLHATVEYNLQRPATATLFIVFLALPWAAAGLKSDLARRRRKRKLPVPTTESVQNSKIQLS